MAQLKIVINGSDDIELDYMIREDHSRDFNRGISKVASGRKHISVKAGALRNIKVTISQAPIAKKREVFNYLDAMAGQPITVYFETFNGNITCIADYKGKREIKNPGNRGSGLVTTNYNLDFDFMEV